MNMNTPIWVWCYLSMEDKHHTNRADMPPLSVWPQAHTYAFASEIEAKEHPENMGWYQDHGYVLQKVYLQ